MPQDFYLALVDAADSTFSDTDHARKDYEITALELVHNEGDFPRLTLDIKNPRDGGFLAPSKNQWCWLSALEEDGAIEPLFFGRIIGTPEDLHNEKLRVAFIGRPADIAAQRTALAETLKVAPYWDPVFIALENRDDPDTVIDARPVRWHIDRTDHTLTVSSIIAGEDGTLTIPVVDIPYSSVRMAYTTPLRRIEVEGRVYWEQHGIGTVDLTQSLLASARAAGSRNHAISTYTGSGFANELPTKGARIGSGWTVETATLRRGDGIWFPATVKTIIMTGPLLSPFSGNVGNFPLWNFRPTFIVRYDVTRSKSEILRFTLEADVQAVVAEPGDDEVLRINFASADVGEPVDDPDSDNPDGTLPIGDRRRRSYFITDRGRQSLEFMIAAARTQLLRRARAVEVQFDTKWDYGVQMSCRMNARLDDPRLPGGTATGKIIGYALIVDDQGRAFTRVKIGCMVGNGNTVTETAGDPSYVAAGYVEAGYQKMTGATIMPIAGEVTYDDYSGTAINDDGVNFDDMTAASVVDNIQIINGQRDQESVLDAVSYQDIAGAIDALNQIFTEALVELVPLEGGPFETEFDVTVSDLMVPKTVDLEAA